MIENKKGSIVNVGSLAGKNGNENLLPAYSVSKAGVHIFSRVLAKQVVKDGIRVNSIAPATIETDITSGLPKDIVDVLLSNNPMGRMGYPEEVANLILFLSSEKASYITGQCINVSGGKGDY
jgi:3-oxoacyl-[acyl-carrier protein] reductase